MTMRVKQRKTGSKSATNWLSASVSGLEVIKKLTIVDRSIQYHNINSTIQYHSSDSMSDQTQQCSAVMFFSQLVGNCSKQQKVRKDTDEDDRRVVMMENIGSTDDEKFES